MTIESKTEQSGAFRQVLHAGTHTFHADVAPALGGQDSAPGPHEYFDASLAACKALTATWYAKKHGIALERVETHVERDDSRERQGFYSLRVKLAFHGALSAEDKQRLYAAVAQCPVHKLMTSTEVEIVTEPLEVSSAG
ncbi:OsmC family protein [Vitiosangium sp. GDMCC 1.1324]|uniref:OsmC family protein n=1 Tax=Vitiosangium sp. (strain GDMCC 1.1324) TaxID=2138576 RepID=UPI000D37C1AF|nr:OsmC family protein [Vitiosangium sp. GDMCC 1.1324]PTL80527.1 peroxiredoxin [Vitiosangium sp. GDMCC 1.1324]